MDYGRHVYHLYVIQSDMRDSLRERLADAGIESGLHYPTPLHLQDAYKFWDTAGGFPGDRKT